VEFTQEDGVIQQQRKCVIKTQKKIFSGGKSLVTQAFFFFSKKTSNGSKSYVVECVACSKEQHVLNGGHWCSLEHECDLSQAKIRQVEEDKAAEHATAMNKVWFFRGESVWIISTLGIYICYESASGVTISPLHIYSLFLSIFRASTLYHSAIISFKTQLGSLPIAQWCLIAPL